MVVSMVEGFINVTAMLYPQEDSYRCLDRVVVHMLEVFISAAAA
jgi:hypothetical protein